MLSAYAYRLSGTAEASLAESFERRKYAEICGNMLEICWKYARTLRVEDPTLLPYTSHLTPSRWLHTLGSGTQTIERVALTTVHNADLDVSIHCPPFPKARLLRQLSAWLRQHRR